MNFERLTLIIALEVIRNSVALSVTCRIFSPASPVRRKLSSSDKDLRHEFETEGARKEGNRAPEYVVSPCLNVEKQHIWSE